MRLEGVEGELESSRKIERLLEKQLTDTKVVLAHEQQLKINQTAAEQVGGKATQGAEKLNTKCKEEDKETALQSNVAIRCAQEAAEVSKVTSDPDHL